MPWKDKNENQDCRMDCLESSHTNSPESNQEYSQLNGQMNGRMDGQKGRIEKSSGRRNNKNRKRSARSSHKRMKPFYPGNEKSQALLAASALPGWMAAKAGGGVHRQVKEVHRGDVWFAELGFHSGTSVEEGCRPVVVLSNEMANTRREVATVVPMTSKHKHYYLPTHVPVTGADLTDRDEGREFKDCLTMAEQITTISRQAFVTYMGRITDEGKLREIEEAVAGHLALSTSADAVPATPVSADSRDSVPPIPTDPRDSAEPP